jgi:hypothetical protein
MSVVAYCSEKELTINEKLELLTKERNKLVTEKLAIIGADLEALTSMGIPFEIHIPFEVDYEVLDYSFHMDNGRIILNLSDTKEID